jgi:endonuclease/exonuclease/phosphatase family metal-dependent hydrolase
MVKGTVMETKDDIVFANVAGGARDENCDPDGLGRAIAKQVPEPVVVGLAECIVSGGVGELKVEKAGALHSTKRILARPSSLGRHRKSLDDLRDCRSGLGGDWEEYYFSHLNSQDHRSEAALRRKWEGEEAVPRLRGHFRSCGSDQLVVHHGFGVLVRPRHGIDNGVSGIVLRPAGIGPALNPQNDPREFEGNRDSEPRTMTVVETTILGQRLLVGFCHLGTCSNDTRVGPALAEDPGPRQRLNQVEVLCEYFRRAGKELPVVLLGDFNARPGTRELTKLADYGFRHVMPEGWPPGKSSWGRGYAFGDRDLAPPIYDASEQAKGRPFTHRRHGILIDHVFVRGFGGQWGFKVRILRLADGEGEARVTDHLPVVLTMKHTGG